MKEFRKKNKQYISMTFIYPLENINNDINVNNFRNNDKIFICFYKIITNSKYQSVKNPFLQFLLFKYPRGKEECLSFPFTNFHKGSNPSSTANKLASNISGEKNHSFKAFLSNSDGHYFFYEYLDSYISLNNIDRKHELWWCLIDEICNYHSVVNFSVHKYVYLIFYQNPLLIYLKDNENNNIEIPVVSFFGGATKIIPYVASLGLRANANKIFGSYYYLGSYNYAMRNAGWSPNNRLMCYFDKPSTDENGKLFDGSIIRYATFLGKYRAILYRQTDPFYWFFKYLDTPSGFDKKSFNKYKAVKGKWAEKYDALIISSIKYKNMKGYFNINTELIIKDFTNFYPISIHKVDHSSMKSNWDPFFTKYYIK
ncbi:MAG: hypothetical protein CXT73_06600 [Methanobacteriota archaeon]|nr:MAG: hypothetical protein CXT73_06600 [Euryarchaeota archaeon]